MSSTTKYVLIAVGVIAVAFVAAVLGVALTRDSSTTSASTTAGSTVPVLQNYVGAPGSLQAEKPTPSDLDNVRAQVTTWLVRNGFDGYAVSRVMAFSNNDYIAVETPKGKDAFELLAAPGAGWLMLEPPSMVWNTRYGMMAGSSLQTNWSGTGMVASLMGGGRAAGEWNGWFAGGKTKVTSPAQAVAIANAWLLKAHPGEVAGSDVRVFPGYYTLDTTVGGKKGGMLSVNAETGAVWYHGWHGGFLAERDYSA
jgi:hypothetical protein